MYALLTKRRLCRLGHVTSMHDGKLPKDILCGEFATGSRPTRRTMLRYKDVLKRDLLAGGIEVLAADRSGWRHTTKSAIKTAEQKREEQWEEKRARRRQRAETEAAPSDDNSHAATATGSAVRGSASTATAGAAALPRTDIYRRNLRCLPRQIDGCQLN